MMAICASSARVRDPLGLTLLKTRSEEAERHLSLGGLRARRDSEERHQDEGGK